MPYCFVPGCKSGARGNVDKSMFKPPKDEILLNLWRIKIRRSDKVLQRSDTVCELHFEEQFIETEYIVIINGEEVRTPRGKKKLKENAIPTIFPNLAECMTTCSKSRKRPEEIPITEVSPLSMDSKKNRKHRKCFAPGCISGYKSCKEKVSLFGVPKDPQLFEVWKQIIPRSDQKLNENSVMCEKHFEERFINRNFTYLIGGETITEPRERPSLKPEAIPTIYPNLPSYLSKVIKQPMKTKNIQSNCNKLTSLTPEALPTSIPNLSSSLSKGLKRSRKAKISKSKKQKVNIPIESDSSVDPLPNHISIDDFKHIKLPSTYWVQINYPKYPMHLSYAIYSDPSKRTPEKMVTLKYDDVCVTATPFIYNLPCPEVTIENVEALEDLIKKLDEHNAFIEGTS